MNRITSDSLNGFGFTGELKELIDKYKRRGIIDVEASSKDIAFWITESVSYMSLSFSYFGTKYDHKMAYGMKNLREQDEAMRLNKNK